ncbi:MAG: divergent polysaccharide deacetylase family protein [Candidatus Omnitrophota bacterium]
MVKKSKSKKIPSQDKKAIKVTFFLFLLFAVGAGIFLYLNRNQEQKIEASKSKVEAFSHKPIKAVVIPVKQKKSFPQKISPVTGGKIAFIIDDWGYKMSNCHFLKEIKAPLAVSIMPNLRHSNDIMKCANIYDKDIMLHLPMEPWHNLDPYPENYLITTVMPHATIEKLMDDTFKKMPLITGVNNHMGSKATEDRNLMKFVMKKIKKQGLFFVDSMTALHHSICGQVADDINIPFARRDVFLDNINTKEAIEMQLVELVQKARHQGYAIAIGHDRQLTMQILLEEIPLLQKQGFQIVHVKDLLRKKD